jgi:hypothetical protein
VVRLLGVFACSALFFMATVPLLSQTSSKPRSPGEIAAADRIAMEKRATCQREARAKKLAFCNVAALSKIALSAEVQSRGGHLVFARSEGHPGLARRTRCATVHFRVRHNE